MATPWSQEALQFEIAKGVNSVNMINDILMTYYVPLMFVMAVGNGCLRLLQTACPQARPRGRKGPRKARTCQASLAHSFNPGASGDIPRRVRRLSGSLSHTTNHTANMSTFEPVVRIPDPELLLRAPARPGGYTNGGLAEERMVEWQRTSN